MIYETVLDARCCRAMDGLTEEAALARLALAGFAPPLYLHAALPPPAADRMRALAAHTHVPAVTLEGGLVAPLEARAGSFLPVARGRIGGGGGLFGRGVVGLGWGRRCGGVGQFGWVGAVCFGWEWVALRWLQRMASGCGLAAHCCTLLHASVYGFECRADLLWVWLLAGGLAAGWGSGGGLWVWCCATWTRHRQSEPLLRCGLWA